MNIEKARAYAAAWSSLEPSAVASFYAEDGGISINRGEVSKDRAQIAEMAAGFYAEFPDLVVRLDAFHGAGDHAVFHWTLEGNHSETANYVKVSGWEEWDLNAAGEVAFSRGWFDADNYDAQVAGRSG